jgi:hypothetical protein
MVFMFPNPNSSINIVERSHTVQELTPIHIRNIQIPAASGKARHPGVTVKMHSALVRQRRLLFLLSISGRNHSQSLNSSPDSHQAL